MLPWTKIQFFVGSVFPRWCRSRHWMRWEIKWSFNGQLCQKYFCQKLSKSDSSFLSYAQKCSVCFFRTRFMYTAH